MENIAKAIIEVMKEVKGIDKNMEVGSGNYGYKGVADKDVKLIIGQSMQKNGLCIIPTCVDSSIQIDRWEEEYKGVSKQKQSIMTEVKTKYLLLHSSGESIEFAGYGHGVDSQDKAAGKATTYALKYALLYLFMVPTGHIDDSDKGHSEEKEIPKSTQPVKQKTKPFVDTGSKLDAAISYIKTATSTEDAIKRLQFTKDNYSLSKSALEALNLVVTKMELSK